MQLELDTDHLSAAREALLGARSQALIEFMFQHSLRRPIVGCDTEVLGLATQLGWIEPVTGTRTTLGMLVSDPIREYRFWIDRDRHILGANDYDLLVAARYAGQYVLEPGSGFGSNLLSLQRAGSRCVGLEPVAIYRQFTAIFAEREGLAPPPVVGGSCEALPFPDAEFDVVLCCSAHQYMDVRTAVGEMARVLKPGGQLRILGGVLDLADMARRMLHSGNLRESARQLLTVGNTIGYERFGRRLMVPRGPWSTAAPVYPRPRHMHRWLAEAGLRVRDDLGRRVGSETCFVADKPATVSG